MPRYQVGEKHINFFYASYELNKEYLILKMFNISKEGYWEADAVEIPFLAQYLIKQFG